MIVYYVRQFALDICILSFFFYCDCSDPFVVPPIAPGLFTLDANGSVCASVKVDTHVWGFPQNRRFAIRPSSVTELIIIAYTLFADFRPL